MIVLSVQTDCTRQMVQTQISLIRALTLCNNVCIFLIHYAMGYASLSHLSQSFTGEFLENRCSPFFFSKTTLPIIAKLYEEPPWVGGTQICLEYQGHMNKDGCLSVDINILYPRGACPCPGLYTCIKESKRVG